MADTEKHRAFASAVGNLIHPDAPHYRYFPTSAAFRRVDVDVGYENACKLFVDRLRTGYGGRITDTERWYFGLDQTQINTLYTLIYG